MTDKIQIKKFDISDPENLVNKSILLMGTSGTGKTVIIRDFMNTLKDHVPFCKIISQTNSCNDSYTGIVPTKLIYDNVESKDIDDIIKGQEKRVNLYNIVNDLDTLKETMFVIDLERISADKYYKMNNVYEQLLEKTNPADKDELTATHKKEMIKFLKKEIKTLYNLNRSKIKLNEHQANVIKYLDFNPKMLLILDDCGSDAKKGWGKSTEINKLFYQGRHYHITTIIALQSDKDLAPSLRKNAFVAIFTTAQCATGFFTASTNEFSKEEKEVAKSCISKIYYQSKGFKKLCYLRDNAEKFSYIEAKRRETFQYNPILFEAYKEKKQRPVLSNNFLRNMIG